MVNAALVLSALATLAVVWATRDLPTTSALEARKDKLLPNWDEQTITRIRLRRGDRVLELVRDPGPGADFRIVKPWSERADVATLRAFLGSLERASALRAASAAPGFSAPQLEIELENAGRSQIIALGGAAPAPQGARYAELRLAGEEPRRHVLSPGLVAELDLAWDKFREPRLLEYARSDLLKIEIDGPFGKSQLEQRTTGVFFWLPPWGVPELADPDATDKLLLALSRLSTEHFLEPGVARAALGTETVRVSLETKDAAASPLRLTFGAACPGVPEQRVLLRERDGQSARAGCIPVELAEAMRISPETLTLARPFAARLDQVEVLSLRMGDARLELARKGSGFLLRGPSPSDEVALEPGNQRLSELLGARGELRRNPDLAALGLLPAAGEAVIQVAAADQGSSRSERLAVGKQRGDGTRCVKRDADGVVLCVDADAARAFEPDATLLRSAKLLALAPSELSAVDIEAPKLRQQLRRTPEGGFVLMLPRGFGHDGGLVSDTLQVLGTLRAERWVTARDDGSHGLASPRLRVGIEPAKEPPRQLRVGSETRDGFFAQLSPDPAVFVLSRATVRALETPLIDRALCPFSAAELKSVELRAGARRLLLERSGPAETFRASGLPAARAGELGEALSALRADFTLELGPEKVSHGFANPSLTIIFGDEHGNTERVMIGRRDVLDGVPIAYARRQSVAATFALSATTLAALQEF